MWIEDVSKLENLNELNINIYSIDKNVNIIPIRISDKEIVNRMHNIDFIIHIKQPNLIDYQAIVNSNLKTDKITVSNDDNNMFCKIYQRK